MMTNIILRLAILAVVSKGPITTLTSTITPMSLTTTGKAGCQPIKLTHGNITLDNNNTMQDAQANVTCDSGYYTNTTTIVCQKTGTWSNATCLPKDCGQPHDINFGKVTPQNKTTFQAFANVTCDDGYHPTNETIQCEATGKWSLAECNITKIAYNETCFFVQSACKTPNATCQNKNGHAKCLCKSEDFVYVADQCLEKLDININFKPRVHNRTEHSISVFWNISPDFPSDISKFVFLLTSSHQPGFISKCEVQRNESTNNSYRNDFKSLAPGYDYNFTYYVETSQGVPSKINKTFTAVTRPLTPPGILEIKNVNQTGFEVSWEDNSTYSFSHYHIIISKTFEEINVKEGICDNNFQNTGNCTFARAKNFTSIVFNDLEPGVYYSVSMFTSILGVLSKNPIQCGTYTVPSIPTEITVLQEESKNNSLTVNLPTVQPPIHFNNWILEISSGEYFNWTSQSNNTSDVIFKHLEPGTEYKIIVRTHVPGFNSSPCNLNAYTRPSAPHSIEVQKVFATNFTLLYNVSDDKYSYFRFNICNETCVQSYQSNGMLSKTIGNLTVATLYRIEVYTVINTINGTLESENTSNNCKSSFTAPMQPNASLLEDTIGTECIQISLDNNDNLLFDYYNLTYSKNGEINTTKINRTDEIVTISNLVPGIRYTFKLYTVLQDVTSEKYANVTTYTRPRKLPSVHFSNVSSTSFILKWRDDRNQSYSDLSFVFNPIVKLNNVLNSTYKDGNCTLKRNSANFIEAINLTSGMQYTVSVYAIAGGLLSEGFAISKYTVPLVPKNVSVQQEKGRHNSLTVYLPTAQPPFHFNKWILEISSGKYSNSTSVSNNTQEVIFDHLEPGTEYKIVVQTQVPEFNSSSCILSAYTRPSAPHSIEVKNVFATNLTLLYNVSDDKYSYFRFNICNETCVQSYQSNRMLSKTIGNLSVATLYRIEVYTVINTINGTLESENTSNNCISSFTAPMKPNARLLDHMVNFTSVQISLSNNSKYLFDYYEIIYNKDGKEENRTNISRTDEIVTIPELVPGTSYTFKVYTVLQRIRSETFANITTYTRPAQVQNVTISDTTQSTITITWSTPTEGESEKYNVSFICKSPNNITNMLSKQEFNETNLNSTVEVDPGTKCNVTITTYIGGMSGDTKMIPLNRTSNEKEPDVAAITKLEPAKRSMNVSWSKPLNPNGIIRKYQLLVIDDNSSPTCIQALYTYSCSSRTCTDDTRKCQGKDFTIYEMCKNGTNITDHHTLPTETNVTGLHPYKFYNVTVRAYTKCWGDFLWTRNQTAIDRPVAPPFVENINASETGFNISLNPPNETDRNGVITNYTITYAWMNNTCWNSNDGVIVKETEYTNGSVHEVSNLCPYWFYNITVSALTEVGEGPAGWCDNCYFRTKTSKPGDIRKLEINTTSSNANVTWETPCKTNGIITKYSIFTKNIDTQKNWTDKTDGNMTQFVMQNLLPYSNYSFSVAASTEKGIGTRSIEIKKRTDIAKPHQPRNPRAEKTYSTRIDVKWDTPDLYTGPTRYFCVPVDDKNKNIKLEIKKVHGFKARTCTLTGLDEYWTYSITVTASTDRGNTSATFYVKTAEDKPGKVSYLELKSEKDVTKQRSVNVTWNEPSIRDRNGIIQNYSIVFTNSNNASTCFFTDSSTRYCNYSGLFPGNYSVEVFANTSAGNGLVVMKTVYIQPGAPLRINESEGGPLMAPSADQPKDTERQMAVNLPLKTFLCNTSNGYPTKWGVIVAQNDQATDEPFFGSVRDFTDRISKVYKTWFDVKDMDSIKPYLATYLNLTDSCQQINGVVTQTEHSTVMSHNIYKSCKPCLNSGTQKKRSVTQRDVETHQRFVVGLDGKCSGQQTDRFCNGELQPGRSYRVKTFACTINGCTETKYSNPISTDPDLTVAVASGISSAIVVLAIVGVVVFVLRRKQLACFSKDDGRLVTQSPDEGIHLDKIEHTKKNPSSTPGQGPVKLSEFSDAVERFHRDSDLLFADAYKVLKEKSPSHPMTAAEQQCCRPKNRYTNILPFDHSRVKLRPSDDIEGSDYINANYIPGYSSRREYIATQGPMQATFDDFWRMIWEQNVDTIVMLTKLMEKGRRKCDKYWPDLGEPIFFGDLVVSLQSDSNMSDYNIKIFEVKTKTHRKMVRHFSYLKWPDMGCPETPELLLEFVKAVKQYSNREQQPSSNGPMIVHCSAGVGRTGTFIAVDYLLQHIKDHDEVDIFNLVLEMRNNRLNMVQTEDQYIYIHECIKSFITTQQEEEEQEEDDDEAIYVNTGFGADEENLYANT